MGVFLIIGIYIDFFLSIGTYTDLLLKDFASAYNYIFCY